MLSRNTGKALVVVGRVANEDAGRDLIRTGDNIGYASR